MSSVTFDAYDHNDIDTISPEAPISILWDADCEEGRVTLECTVTPEIEGWYEISLTATDDDGASTIATRGVDVTNIAPWGAEIFAYSNDTLLERDSQMVWHIEEDQAITLVGRASDSANDLADLRHLWQPDFDIDPSDARWLDGQQTSLEVSYGISGMHTVSLDVYDNDDASSGPEQAWFEVTNVAPWIEPFSELLPVAEDQIVEVTAVFGDTASDVDTLVRCWDLDLIVNSDEIGAADDDCDIGGDTMANAWSRAETAPSQIAFHVTDDDGERTMAVLNLTIRNVRPKAVANVTSLTVEVGMPIIFNGEGTTDSSADMEVLTYRWDFNGHIDTDDDGFPANDIDSEGYEVIHIFTEPGTYLVRLTVKDEAAESTVDLQVVVSRSSSGFFGALDAAGGDDPTVVLGLGAVLLILLTVLGIGLLRKDEDSSGAGWQDGGPLAGGDSGAPSAPPPTYAFEQPQSGPPIPAEGLPYGWTTDQWSWYGEQWLVDNSGIAGDVGGGKSRAGGILVTAAEPAGSAEPLSDQQAADVFDAGFAVPASNSLEIPTTESVSMENATAATGRLLMPAEPVQSVQTQSEVSSSGNSDSESDIDPFGALDFDL
jgi:PKD repeat protein